MLTVLSAWIRLCAVLARLRGSADFPEAFRAAMRCRLTAAERRSIQEVETIRNGFLTSRERIQVRDYGVGYASGLAPGRKPAVRSISTICRRAAIPREWGILLFLLVRHTEPRSCLELGTSLGLGAAYVARSLALNELEGVRGRLVTIEGDPGLAGRAADHLGVFGDLVQVEVGRFDERLGSVLERLGEVDWVFIDGHHEEEAAYRYFSIIRPYLSRGACIIADDLEPWSTSVHRAWKRIVAEYPDWPALNLLKLGILAADSPRGAGLED